MATYAKLREDGTLDILTGIPGYIGPTDEQIRQYANSHGYKYVEYTSSPGEWYNSSYEEVGSSIKQVWTEWTADQKIPAIQYNVQILLDSTAAEKNYDNIFTAMTYLDSKNPKFAAEASALRDWRDSMWTECYVYLDKVQKGEVIIPDNWEAVKEVLPKFEWPTVEA